MLHLTPPCKVRLPCRSCYVHAPCRANPAKTRLTSGSSSFPVDAVRRPALEAGSRRDGSPIAASARLRSVQPHAVDWRNGSRPAGARRARQRLRMIEPATREGCEPRRWRRAQRERSAGRAVGPRSVAPRPLRTSPTPTSERRALSAGPSRRGPPAPSVARQSRCGRMPAPLRAFPPMRSRAFPARRAGLAFARPEPGAASPRSALLPLHASASRPVEPLRSSVSPRRASLTDVSLRAPDQILGRRGM
jgi:hypothetical protein